MKQGVAVLFLGCVLLLSGTQPLYAAGDRQAPYVTAQGAVLLDARTGEILFERDAYLQRPPASTTKIITAILALEMGDADELVTVSPKAASVGESTLHLNPGDEIKLGELIEGALVRSGNDACVAIAEQIAGSEEAFVRFMNLKAIALGAKNTHFVNTNGLPAENHYSSAYDLAVMARYALQNEAFQQMVQEKFADISFEKPEKVQKAKNTNKILWEYPWATGVKTGTTNAAGKCLVSSAKQDGRELICVVLNAPDRFGDAIRLLSWGFRETDVLSLGKAGTIYTVYPGRQGLVALALGMDLSECIGRQELETLRIVPSIRDDAKGRVEGSLKLYMGAAFWREIPLIPVYTEELGENDQKPSFGENIWRQVLDLLNQKG